MPQRGEEMDCPLPRSLRFDHDEYAGAVDSLPPLSLSRRSFLYSVVGLSLLRVNTRSAPDTFPLPMSPFSQRLRPMGRILEEKGWYVWCNAPIFGPDGRTHVFFSRWPADRGMGGWLNRCEIAHAVADQPEGPYTVLGPVLQPRGGDFWDATTCHNPHIQRVGDQYALFYLGTSNGKTDTKRIGLATAPSLDGPWTRRDEPLLLPGPADAWDDHCTTNPALVLHPNGEYWLYYKAWNTADYVNGRPPIRGNRKYGLAIAKSLEGPYEKHPANPLVDFSGLGENRQCEDAYVWRENGTFWMIVRDMGVFNHEVGLIMHSNDGITWSAPEVAYLDAASYIELPPRPRHLNRYGRFERPQLLLQDGRPAYLFVTAQGGEHQTSTGFVFRIEPERV
jgi:hypothetical protein